MDDPTTIQVERETREKLKNLKITKHETYDEIINRLIEKHAGSEEKGKTDSEELRERVSKEYGD